MARQPQLEDSSVSSRMQSAPINIAYGNQETQQFWRDHYNRWNNHQNQLDDDEEEQEEQNHHAEEDEELMMIMQDGFSGGVINGSEDATISIGAEEDKENDVMTAAVAEQEEHQKNEITVEKNCDEMSEDDLFEQLLAENELKLRHLISAYVGRSSCSQMSHLSFF